MSTESARYDFMLFLEEVLISDKGNKEELLAENNLELSGQDWIQLELRLIKYRILFWRDRLGEVLSFIDEEM